VSCERVPKSLCCAFVYGVSVATRPQTLVEVRECTVVEGVSCVECARKEVRIGMLQVLRRVSGGEADPVLSWHHKVSCARCASPVGERETRRKGM